MKIRDTRTGKVMPCTTSTWDNIKSRGKDKLFEVVEADTELQPIAVKRSVVEVEVPQMPTLPEHTEVKDKRTRRKKDETNE